MPRRLQRFGDAPFAADRDTLKAIFDRPDNIPLRRPARRQAVQFLAGRRASARAVADDDARKLPQRSARLGRSARPRRARRHGGEDWILERRRDAARARTTAPSSACRAAARDAVVLREFDLATRDFVAGRLSSCRSQGRHRLARPRHAAAVVVAGRRTWRPRSGYARTVRLWRRGTDPLAAPVIFETARTRWRVWAERRPRRAGRTRCGSSTSSASSTHAVWIGDRSGPKTRLDLPTDVWADLASRLARGQAAHPVDGRRRDPRARHRAGYFVRRLSSPATAASRSCSSPGRAPRAAGVSSGAAAGWCCRSSMI